jgi:hypothetical protein
MPRAVPLTRKFTFIGDSMLPLFEEGDLIWARTVPVATLKQGDLMVFARFVEEVPRLIVHRVLSVEGKKVYLQGDARSELDEAVEAGDFMGRVIAFRRDDRLVQLGSLRGQLWDKAARLYAVLALRWWHVPVSHWLRRLVLAPARGFFSFLFGTRSGWQPWAVGLICAAVFSVYGATLGHGYAWDDHIYIEGNAFIQNPANLQVLFNPRYYFENQQLQAGSRPVFLASLLLDRLIWGASAWGHHLSNVLLHAANAVWLYVLVLGLFVKRQRRWLAVLAGLVFAVHPILSEAVSAISFRTDMLAAFFTFVGLYLLRRLAHAQGASFAIVVSLAGLCYLLGLLSKEMAVTLPLLALLVEFYFPSNSWTRRRIAIVVGVLVLVAGMFAAFWGQRFAYRGVGVAAFEQVRELKSGQVYQADSPRYVFAPGPPIWREIYDDTSMRAGTMLWVQAQYLSWLAYPRWLLTDRAPRLVPSWTHWRSLCALLLLLGMGGIAVYMRRRLPLLGLGTAWILVALLPVAGIIPLFNPQAERYLYLVTPGVVFMIVGIVEFSERYMRRVALFSVLLLLGLYGFKAHARALEWRDDLTLFNAVQNSAPVSPRTYYNRAKAHWKIGQVAQAQVDYQTALRMQPDYAEAWLNLGTLLRNSGDAPQAERCYERAVLYGKHTPLPAFIFAKYLEKAGKIGRARLLYRRALEISPHFAPAADRLHRLSQKTQ